ncbi:MAG: hypothetical protein GYA02_03525 [Clostridiaceae bacterium]|jgi:predicted dehydrogenase|nr:hypothetical protein [Clostridiaceae bacterium]
MQKNRDVPLLGKIKVEIIGTGGISSVHIQGYKALDNVELYAACDLYEQKVKRVAEENNSQLS